MEPRCLPDSESAEIGELVATWRARLGVTQAVRCVAISQFQVVGENGEPGAELVGVVYDGREAVIYHTRGLQVDDVVHELLHVRHPDWSEARVVAETARLAPDLSSPVIAAAA